MGKTVTFPARLPYRAGFDPAAYCLKVCPKHYIWDERIITASALDVAWKPDCLRPVLASVYCNVCAIDACPRWTEYETSCICNLLQVDQSLERELFSFKPREFLRMFVTVFNPTVGVRG